MGQPPPPTPHPRGAEALFRPLALGQSVAVRYDFSGFGDEGERGRDYVLRRRLIDLEREMRAMGERMVKLEKDVELKLEKDMW